jgi:hypothetical protein
LNESQINAFLSRNNHRTTLDSLLSAAEKSLKDFESDFDRYFKTVLRDAAIVFFASSSTLITKGVPP